MSKGFDAEFSIGGLDGRPSGDPRYFVVSAHGPSREGRIFLSILGDGEALLAQCLVTPEQLRGLRDFLGFVLIAQPWELPDDEWRG